jgi:hypothetical protein
MMNGGKVADLRILVPWMAKEVVGVLGYKDGFDHGMVDVNNYVAEVDLREAETKSDFGPI